MGPPPPFKAQMLEMFYSYMAARATDETEVYSFTKQMLRNPCVQLIIKIGVDLLPFLFDDLARGKWGCHWRMGAIQTILKDNDLPSVEVPDRFCGRVRAMVLFYARYGLDHGYFQVQGLGAQVYLWLRTHLGLHWYLWAEDVGYYGS